MLGAENTVWVSNSPQVLGLFHKQANTVNVGDVYLQLRDPCGCTPACSLLDMAINQIQVVKFNNSTSVLTFCIQTWCCSWTLELGSDPPAAPASETLFSESSVLQQPQGLLA